MSRLTTTCARQRGVALITAVLLVALGTIVATAIAFQGAMMARRGAATFALDQSISFAEAAEAIAAYALKEDENKQVDHPGEDWAQPFGPVEVVPGVSLEAVLQDMQGKFNLNSLVKQTGEKDPDAIARFKKLLRMLDMEEKWASLITDWIDSDIEPTGFDGGEDNLYLAQNPPYRALNGPITSPSELLALPGFGRDNYLRLKPYVTALPRDAVFNVCTAPSYVLDAMIATESEEGEVSFSSDEETFTKNREGACFPGKDLFTQRLPPPSGSGQGQSSNQLQVDEKSQYFRLTSVITVGDTQFALYSVMFREGQTARPILRTFTSD